MVVMFGSGVTSLVWLTWLPGVMVLEKAIHWGRQIVPAVGVRLIGLGLLGHF